VAEKHSAGVGLGNLQGVVGRARFSGEPPLVRDTGPLPLPSRPPARRRPRPFREAALTALAIFTCFSGSALWIYYQARQRELTHHREAIEAAAWRAAGSVEPQKFQMSSFLTSLEERLAVLGRLYDIKFRESPVARIQVLHPADGEYVVIFDTNAAEGRLAAPALLIGSEKQQANVAMKAGRSRVVYRPDGSVKVYVPIRDKSGRTIGVAAAESAAHNLEQGLASIRFAAFSSVAVGAGLAILVGVLVYSARRKTLKADQLLRRAQLADHLIVGASGEIFYEHDLASDAIQWRGDIDRALGVQAGVLPRTGSDWEDWLHPADRPAFQETRREREASQSYSIEYRVRKADGDYAWLLDRGGVLPGDEDAGPCAVGAMLDITASRQAEQRLRDVVEAAGEYIWEVDEHGKYTYLSERVFSVLGRKVEEMIGRPAISWVPEDDVAEVRSRFSVHLDQKTAFRDFEHRFTRADGQTIWLSVNGVPTFDANSRWSGYSGAAMDITPRKETEQALIREKEAANAAVRAKSQFLAMMSHEIRTPLNSVLGFADLLATTSLDEAQREQLGMIGKSGNSLLELLSDILDFSRLESEGLQLDYSDFDVRNCLQEVVDLFVPAAAAKDLGLSFQAEESVPAAVRTDRMRLRQILLNLVANAVKFTEGGGILLRASFATAGGRPMLTIRVTDTGIGVPPEKRALLFQPFSQVDSSATRRYGGTGLGLAICRKLAEILGGEAGLEESSESGSTFYFSVRAEPAAHASETAERAAAASPVEFHVARPAKLLVVEDNRVNRLLVERMLKALGLDCDAVENGQQCLEAHAVSPYEVIFMDLQMPVLDGISATKRIRNEEAATAAVKIVALTADAMAGDRERCLAAGMNDYLPKPIRIGALAGLLEHYGILSRN